MNMSLELNTCNNLIFKSCLYSMSSKTKLKKKLLSMKTFVVIFGIISKPVSLYKFYIFRIYILHTDKTSFTC